MRGERAADSRGWVQRTLVEKLAALIDGPIPAVLEMDPVRPLAIGSGNLLLAMTKPDASKTSMRKAISGWVRAPSYLAAAAKLGAMRHALDGSPVEPVSEEHGLYAYKQRIKWKARRKDKAASRAELARGEREGR